MRDRPTRRRSWWRWLWIPLAVVVAGCGGLTGCLFWVFAPPANPTNQPQVVHTFPGVWPDHLRYSPDGTLLAVGTHHAKAHGPGPAGVAACYPAAATLTVFDLTTGATAFTATYSGWAYISAVEFTPDGDRLLVSLSRPVVQDDLIPPTRELVAYSVPGFREAYRGRPGANWRADLHLVSGPTLVFSSEWHPAPAHHKLTAWSYPDLTYVADFPVRMNFPRGVTGIPGGAILVWGTDTDSVSVVERFDRGGTPLGRFDLSALAGTKAHLEANLRIDPTTGRVWVRTRESEQEFDPATGKPIGPVSASPFAYPSPFFGGWATPDDTRFVVTEKNSGRSALLPPPWYQLGTFLRVRNTATGAERRWRVAGRGGSLVAVSPDGSRVAAAYDESENRGPVGVRVWVSP